MGTTYQRLTHVDAQRSAMDDRNITVRARAMCGEAGDQAPICFHPDLSLSPKERWETLLTIGIDTAGGNLLYSTGNPMVMAEKGHLCF